MKKRPLIAVALFYLAGILLAQWTPPLLPLFGAAFGLMVVFFVWKSARPALLCLLLVLAGWINFAQRTAVISPHDLRTIMTNSEEIVTVRGKLSETPYHRVHEIKDNEVWSSMARMEVSAIHFGDGEWQPAFGKIVTSTKEFLPNKYFAGQIVEVNGVLRKARGPVAEGLFNYREFLANEGIYHQLGVKLVSDWRIIGSPAKPPLADRFCAWARRTLARGLPVEDDSLRLEWALTLGWKPVLTEDISDSFIKAATYHIFAVDGLRIAIVSAIFFYLFRAIGVPRAWCGLLTLPFLGFYAAMTGWPASAIRAIVMITVVFGGWALKRPSDLINSLFAAALVILVWDPRELFQAGFQLSFFVVLCIILILPFFNKAGEKLLKTDPYLPESLLSRWQKFWRVPARWIVDLFLSSLAAWLGSIPLVVYYFHLVTPISSPANVLAVPLCGLVLISNLAGLFFAPWLPFLTLLFNNAGWFFMECIRKTSDLSAHFPAAYFYLPTPGWFTIALYYFLLLAMLTGWMFRKEFRIWKIGAALVLVLVWCGLWLRERPVARMTVLPLNGGHAVYVKMQNGRGDWLIDCGNEAAAAGIIKPFLQAQGVNHLSNLLLTHGEAAYSGGVRLVAEQFSPRNVYLSPVRFRSPSYREFQLVAAEQPDRRDPVQAGDQLGPFTVLHPANPKMALAKANDNVLVLLGEIYSTRVLLLSDIGRLGQNELLSLVETNTNLLRADIVIAGIPGDDAEPLCDSLLNAIQPRAIIIADSRLPASKRAGAKLKQRLAREGVPVFYTSACDAVTIDLKRQGWELRGMDGSRISSSEAKAPR